MSYFSGSTWRQVAAFVDANSQPGVAAWMKARFEADPMFLQGMDEIVLQVRSAPVRSMVADEVSAVQAACAMLVTDVLEQDVVHAAASTLVFVPPKTVPGAGIDFEAEKDRLSPENLQNPEWGLGGDLTGLMGGGKSDGKLGIGVLGTGSSAGNGVLGVVSVGSGIGTLVAAGSVAAAGATSFTVVVASVSGVGLIIAGIVMIAVALMRKDDNDWEADITVRPWNPVYGGPAVVSGPDGPIGVKEIWG